MHLILNERPAHLALEDGVVAKLRTLQDLDLVRHTLVMVDCCFSGNAAPPSYKTLLPHPDKFTAHDMMLVLDRDVGAGAPTLTLVLSGRNAVSDAASFTSAIDAWCDQNTLWK